MEGDYKTQNGNSGCRISTTKGFVFVLLAALLAVSVGILVHLAGSREVTCKVDLGSLSKVGWSSPSELVTQCGKLAEQGDSHVCSACPTPPLPNTPELEPETTPEPEKKKTPINYRLPSTLKPVHYDVELKPNIYGNDTSNFQMNGSVSIDIDVLEATDNITLHSDWLNVTESSVSLVSDQPVTPTVVDVSVINTTQFLVISLDGSLVKGSRIRLKMNFTSRLRTDRFGFYSSSYLADNNETIYLAVTMFEATYARSAFPCFDEPALKATFNFTLLRKEKHARNYTTLSNTDIIDTQPRDNGYVADVHAKTPVMPTYLLAFVVSDFRYVENVTYHGDRKVKYRTWARPNLMQNVHLTHDWGVRIFNWLQNHFEPPFPLYKFDNIAVPSFRFGAMENWGLATYREDIVYRPGFTTTNCYTWTGLVIAHELAHQWFGNIVSPRWWWWLWLNEGFAMYWEWILVTELFPQRREEEQFLVKLKYKAMLQDSTRSSHPMNNDKMESHAQIETSFDEITYSKGGTLVRMMSMFMGKSLFIQALNHYLKRHQYGVADHNDLFNVLTEEAASENRPINMTDIMDNWVTQMNFPLVHVTRSRRGVIHVTQERYLGSPSEQEKAVNDSSPYDYLWEIPITYTSSTEKNFTKSIRFEDRKWLKKTNKEGDIFDSVFPDSSDEDSWVYVNTESHYFYVNYDLHNWNALIKQLNHDFTVIPPINRAQLLHDSWYIAEAGRLNHSIALRLMSYLKDDMDYVPWRALHRFLFVIDGHLKRSVLYDAFRKFMVDLSKKAFDHYGVVSTETEVTVHRFQRTRIMKYACYYGNMKCQKKVLELFQELKQSSDNSVIHPDLRSIVYCGGIQYGDSENFEFVWSKYTEKAKSPNPELKKESGYLLKALACVREPWRITRLFQSMREGKIKKDDVLTLGKELASNPYGRDLVWNALKASYEMIAMSELSNKTVSRMITGATSSFNTQDRYVEIEDFMKTHNVTAHEGVFKAVLKKTKENIEWMDRHYTVIEHWLRETGYLQPVI
ncbi:aminopeptidase N-like [Gigantopelta aegis]|uniref:aminopeptidase N-like n=1 Tax=Gigantopelta aegis TaxID=1735272 RepID=UPI001B88DF2E|nr:aminopeptidase N-like [Gigantopelta aegis]